jgi:adsorption protein B
MGWSGGAAERWMRLRDRQSLLAAALLFAAYLACALWLLLAPLRLIAGVEAAPFPALLATLVQINVALLAWRIALRAVFTGQAYGWREALRSAPRALVANFVAMLAAAAALARYRRLRRTGRATWGKTAHIFPSAAAVQ